MKIAREHKTLRYKLIKYMHIKENEKRIYVVHKNSISLADSFRSNQFVYSKLCDSHSSLTEGGHINIIYWGYVG